MADNERLVGQDTQLAQIEQALNRLRAGKAVLLEFRGTGRLPDRGVLVVRSGRRWPGRRR